MACVQTLRRPNFPAINPTIVHQKNVTHLTNEIYQSNFVNILYRRTIALGARDKFQS
jgi:hypothetical protein